MGFRTARENTTETERSSIWSRDETDSSRHQRQRRGPRFTAQECEDLFGIDMYMDGLEVKVQRLADSHGAGQVRQWADEGMTVDTMGKPRDMRAFRERQKERPAEVPKDIERRNAKSVQRSRGAHHEASKAGDANVPDSVRDVISSPGKQLDSSIQRVMEERMGDNLGDVRIHTGPQAAKACEDINARAFTVGNHIAFNRGEYDPDSLEGQHILAHELVHVRQQTGKSGGRTVAQRLSKDADIEIGDPDSQYEREAEQVATQIVDPSTTAADSITPSPLSILRTEESQYYEHVIEAIKRNSDLDDEDIERIKQEVKEGKTGTDYNKAKGHDELNIKVIQEAEQVVQEKAEAIQKQENIEESLDTLYDLQFAAKEDKRRNQSEDGAVADRTDGQMTADEMLEQIEGKPEELEAEYGDIFRELDELDRELSDLFSEQNFRLTETQEQAMEGIEDKLADHLDGPAGDLVAAGLTSYVLGTSMGVSLSGLVTKIASLGQVSTAVVASGVLLTVAFGLSLIASTLAESYGEMSDTGQVEPRNLK
ncbi:DUF4157 domain-containing protein [Halogeometricum borinquense]|uniref:eCIS core domain-containing protein n=1 Tax=Halogeometricum borinquense TaxID=60847 RepID=UPI001EF88B6C|nr:DUF4157 domain-containing protein [Halogeometricum borinquense]